MQTNQCFNNHWTFSASAVSSTGVPKERVPTERIGLSFSRSKRWPGEVPRQRALRRGPGSAHVLRLMICAKLQSYKVTIFSAENAQMERLEDLAYEKQGEKRGKNIGTDMMFAECESKSTIRKLSDFAEEWKNRTCSTSQDLKETDVAKQREVWDLVVTLL